MEENEDKNELGFEVTNETIPELSESYLEELYDDLTFECISDHLFFIKNYTKENGLPITEKLTFSDLFKFIFEDE
jgi:hypothetical protein